MLTAGGAIYTWGRGKYGNLGHGDFKSTSVPTAVKAMQGMAVIQVRERYIDGYSLLITIQVAAVAMKLNIIISGKLFHR